MPVSAVMAQAGGQTLYNGIVLPAVWPPVNQTFSRAVTHPAYLDTPPAVINIDVGRQLFVDTFLIDATTLTQTFHSPQLYSGNPVIVPDQAWEKDDATRIEMAMPFSDGAWYDSRDQMFKLWYYAGDAHTALAISQDGIHWTKPTYDVIPGTNIVLKDPSGRRDSASVIIDYAETNPAKRYKMFRSYRVSNEDVNHWATGYYYSADGVHWSQQVSTSGFHGGRTTVSYNPFRSRFVYSLRSYEYAEQTRIRRYWESSSPTGPFWNTFDEPTRWVQADSLDTAYQGLNFTPQLYSFETFPYESVTMGLYDVLEGFPQDRPHQNELNQIYLGTSRDGFYFDRSYRQPFIGVADQVSGQNPPWNWANVQSGGGPIVVGDNLYFYVSGSSAKTVGTTTVETRNTGLAILRRDGFASMDGNSGGGTLITRPVKFTTGQDVYVNLAGASSTLAVEILDSSGTIIPGFTGTASGDHTSTKVIWSDPNADVSQLAGQTIKFKFALQNGSLYSFWIGKDAQGASGGYVPSDTSMPAPSGGGSTGGGSSTSTCSGTVCDIVSGVIRFFVGTNGDREAMRITNDGNVGIGTSAPTRRLEVAFATDVHDGAHENIESSMVVTNNSSTDPDSEWHGIQSHLELTGSKDILRGQGTSEDVHSSMRAYANYTGSAFLGSLAGLIARVDNEGTGTIENLFQFMGGQFNNTNHGRIKNAYGLYLPRTVYNNGTIDNMYGVYVSSLQMNTGPYPGGVQTNTPYSFYAQDEKAYNYFAGKTGIGTTTPFAKFSISANNGETTRNVFMVASSTATATTTHFIVLNNGNVGVGTTSPVERLSVAGPIYLADSSPVATANRLYAVGSDLYWSGGQIAGATVGDGLWSTDGANIWRPTGNVGIGTTSPYASFSVAGSSGIAADVVTATSVSGSSNFYGNVNLATGGGRVGIGTANPVWNLQIKGRQPVLALSDSDAGQHAKHWVVSSNGGTFSIGTTSDTFTATSTYLRIGNAGTVSLNGTALIPTVGLNVSGQSGVNAAATGLGGAAYFATASNGGYGFRVDSAQVGYMFNGTSGLAIFVPNDVRSIFRGTMSIGTVNNPDRRVEIFDSSQAQLRLTQTDNTVYTDVQTTAAGNLVVTPSSGRMGIGTSSPWAALSVGPTGSNGPLMAVGSSAGTSFVISRNGNVGIGTSTPGDSFSVAGPIYFSSGVPAATQNRLYAVGPDLYWSGSPLNNQSGGAGTGEGGGTPKWETDGTNLWRVEGRVGIGTNAPVTTLEAAGTAPALTLTDTSAGTNLKRWNLSSQNGSFIIGTSSDTGVSGAGFLRIGANGNIALNGLPVDVNVALLGKSSSGLHFTAYGNGGTAYYASVPTNGYAFRTDDASIGYMFNNTTGLAIFVPNDVRSIFRGSMSIGKTGNPQRRLEILDSGQAQLRLTHTDNTAFTDVTTNAQGNLIFSPTGGNVGIGASAPATTLDVRGLIRATQTTATSCTAAVEGAFYYNSTDKHFYGCDGTQWKQLD